MCSDFFVHSQKFLVLLSHSCGIAGVFPVASATPWDTLISYLVHPIFLSFVQSSFSWAHYRNLYLLDSMAEVQDFEASFM